MPGYQNDRFVVSFRDKDEHATAFERESIMDETTGELLCKTQAGDTLSYDNFQRWNQNINQFTKNILDRGLKGDIFNITPSMKPLPYLVESDSELLDEPITFIGDISAFAVNVDTDIILSNSTYNTSNCNYSVIYEYVLYNLSEVVLSGKIMMTTANITNNIITIPFNTRVTKIEIKSITIKSLDTTEAPQKILLNSINLFIQYKALSGIIGIDVAQLPDKTTYDTGEVLDLTGMIVNAYYADDTFEPITDYTVSGWDDQNNDTEIIITVEYQGFTDSFIVYNIGNSFVYEIREDETVNILRYIGNRSVVYIPSTIDGYPVTSIAGTAFRFTNVTTVHIPDGVVTIE